MAKKRLDKRQRAALRKIQKAQIKAWHIAEAEYHTDTAYRSGSGRWAGANTGSIIPGFNSRRVK